MVGISLTLGKKYMMGISDIQRSGIRRLDRYKKVFPDYRLCSLCYFLPVNMADVCGGSTY